MLYLSHGRRRTGLLRKMFTAAAVLCGLAIGLVELAALQRSRLLQQLRRL